MSNTDSQNQVAPLQKASRTELQGMWEAIEQTLPAGQKIPPSLEQLRDYLEYLTKEADKGAIEDMGVLEAYLLENPKSFQSEKTCETVQAIIRMMKRSFHGWRPR